MDRAFFMNRPKWDIIPLFVDKHGKSVFIKPSSTAQAKDQYKNKALPPPPKKSVPALPPKPVLLWIYIIL